MNIPSLLFVDEIGVTFLKERIPQLEVDSQIFDFMKSASCLGLITHSFDAKNQCIRPLPPSRFTRHRLRSRVLDPIDQPLLLEAGYISFGKLLISERNPANFSLHSFSSLKRRALPGLRFPWWPFKRDRLCWTQIPGSRRSRLTPIFSSASACILSSFNNPNWYHWLTLPGLTSLPSELDDRELVISDRSIKLLSAGDTPMLNRVASLATALYPNSRISFQRGPILFKDIEFSFIENHTPLVCNPFALNQLRSASLSSLKISQRRFCSDRIYLRRGQTSSRPFLGEPMLEKSLCQLGFVVISPVSLSLDQCIAFVSNARWVVAPHGAALANLIFALPGTRILELLPGNLDNYGHYALISAALSLHHNFWVGRSVNSGGFEVDQGQLLAWITAEILENNP